MTNTGTGIDGVKAIVLKRIPDIMIQRMTQCFNICLKEGRFLNEWKKAALVLIPKSKIDLIDPKVRSICLLNETGKAMERVIVQRIELWMMDNPNAQLARNQFCFRKAKSTYDALHYVQGFVTKATQEGAIVVGVSLDITNAFNSIKWRYIRKALKEKGFPDYIRNIIDGYLSDRTIEYVTQGGAIQTRKVTSGVPLGSVLGPLLWNITYDWILNIPVEPGCSVIGYADDTLILTKAKDIDDAINKANLQSGMILKRFKKLEKLPLRKIRRK